MKLDIYIKKGTHETENESAYLQFNYYRITDKPPSLLVNKQINDKERIAAGMENPNLKNLVEQCIKEED